MKLTNVDSSNDALLINFDFCVCGLRRIIGSRGGVVYTMCVLMCVFVCVCEREIALIDDFVGDWCFLPYNIMK